MNKSVKRVLSVLLTLTLVLGCLTVFSSAAGEDISVKTDRSECLQGEKITVTIFFPARFQKVAAMNLKLVYNSAKFSLVSVTDGEAIEKALDPKVQDQGRVHSRNDNRAGEIVWGLAGSKTLDFSGTFATAVFEANKKASGDAEFSIELTNATNADRNDVKASVSTGSATVNILKVAVNDIVFDITGDGKGYVVCSYFGDDVTSVSIPSAFAGLPVVEISDEAFENHPEIKNLTIPDSVTKIGKGAFRNCTGLTKVVIPDSVESIGASAFEGCSAMTAVTLPLGLKTIEAGTFRDCLFLKSVDIPFTVTNVKTEAFAGCACLEEIRIAKTTSTVAKDAFKGSFSSPTFVITDGNTAVPAYISANLPEAKTRSVTDINLGKATVAEKVTYTGVKAYKPAVTVTNGSGKALKSGTDYRIAYKNNKAAGTATVYVAGLGTYGEGITLHFAIVCPHTNTEEKIVRQADCTHSGLKKVTCKLCGHVSEVVIPEKGHKDGAWVYDVRPSIDKEGKKHQLCSVCEAVIKSGVTVPKVYPDLDNSKTVNAADALLVLQYSTGKLEVLPTEEQQINADTNGDGVINSADALTILQIAIGKIVLK